MHACDGQTDRRTDRQTDRQTDRILIARPRLHCMQRGKNDVNSSMNVRACALKPLSPMECVGSSCSEVLKRDIDDASRDSGIGCDSILSSLNQFSSPAMKLTPARRLDFSDILSPTDTVRFVYLFADINCTRNTISQEHELHGKVHRKLLATADSNSAVQLCIIISIVMNVKKVVLKIIIKHLMTQV